MGELFDRLSGSPAWQRLQDRSPSGADQFTVGIKHDIVNVLQALAAAADESLTAANAASLRAEKLERQLYDPKSGDFANQRSYVDGRMSTWTKWLSSVAGGIAVAVVAYLAQRGGV